MVLYLYNESQKNLMITSLDGRTTMVTEDNACFQQILEMCKDPNADYDIISILLDENIWDFTSSNGKVTIHKEPDDIYYTYLDRTEPLPSYLKNIILERQNSEKLDTFKEVMSKFLEVRYHCDKNIVDGYLNKNKFCLTAGGNILIADPAHVFITSPLAIKHFSYDKEDTESFVVERDDAIEEVDINIWNALVENNIKFVFNLKELKVKTLNELKTKDSFRNFWKDYNVSSNEEAEKRIKNEVIRDKFESYLIREFCIFEHDKLEPLINAGGNINEFVRVYWEEV